MENKFVLGTANFGMAYGVNNPQKHLGPLSMDEIKRILDVARDNGIDTIDTAVAYGDACEKLGHIGVKDFKIVTKLPAIPDDCTNVTEWVDSCIELSLTCLGVERLHGVLLHHPEDALGPHREELHSALNSLWRSGLIGNIGVSIYDAHTEMEPLWNMQHFDIVQAPLNILDRRLLLSGWAEQLHNSRTTVQVRSVFLQGLLLTAPWSRPSKFAKWQPLWDAWDHTVQATGVTKLEACLRYVASDGVDRNVDEIVIGVDNAEQLKRIVSVAERPVMEFPQWELADDVLIDPRKWNEL